MQTGVSNTELELAVWSDSAARVNVHFVVDSVEKVSLLNFITLNRNDYILWRGNLNQYSKLIQSIGKKFRPALGDRLFQHNFVVS